ncbi:MAG: rhodanese-like domain-containing protein [Myxococcaceae bacterium]
MAVFSVLGWSALGRAADADGLRQRVDRRMAQVPSVSTDELARLMTSSKVLLLDVRTAEEFSLSHLPGAVRAETEASQRAAIESAAPDTVIVAYCAVGWRSGLAVEKLQPGSPRRLFNLRGSIFAWANEGRPLTDGAKAVQVVHPFDRTWGQLLDKRFWPPDWRSED